MKSRPASSIVAGILIALLLAPSAFFVAAQPARAQIPGIGVPVNDFITEIKTTLTAVATVAEQVNTYVLQPLAFVLSGNLLKMITANVLAFVIGQANGTGAPQFVQNLQGHMQLVGDNRAFAFFTQFGKNSNSPFATAISSSLRLNYLQNTSMAGFFAANRSTLGRYSPNVNAFLSGNWSQGGVNAWFALTTQNQNNPYTLYQASQSQLASVVNSAQSARLAELNWNQGFLSWCGPAQEGDPQTGVVGTAPGDACTSEDGVDGIIKTPGSTIKAALDEALGLEWNKIAGMGSLANEINQILGSVGTIMGTVNFATQLLGGPNSGGLFGVGQTSASNPTSRLVQYQNSSLLGVNNSTVYQNAATLPVSGETMLQRVAQYETAWDTIRATANAASVALLDLASFCTAAATADGSSSFANTAEAQASAALAAITTQIAPVIARADAADVIIAEARAAVQKIQASLGSTDPAVQNTSLAYIQALQTMAPSDTDSITAAQDAQIYGQATAIPTGSLTVTGGSTVDRMSLIGTNAAALKSTVCTKSGSRPPEFDDNND